MILLGLDHTVNMIRIEPRGIQTLLLDFNFSFSLDESLAGGVPPLGFQVIEKRVEPDIGALSAL